MVGLCLERGPEMVTAILAAWKAGAAYLPLDPDYPAGRLAAMLAGSRARLLVTRGGLAAGPAGWPRRRWWTWMTRRSPAAVAQMPPTAPPGRRPAGSWRT